MKYLPTIDLWQPGVIAALRHGNLKLQPGQWVRCGQERPSRFVCVKGKGSCSSVWAAHPEAEKGTSESFPRLMQAAFGKRCRPTNSQA